MAVLAGLVKTSDSRYVLKPQHAIDEFYESMLQWFDNPNEVVGDDFIKFIGIPLGASVFLGSWNFDMVDSALAKWLQNNTAGHRVAFKLPKGTKVKDFSMGFTIQVDGTLHLYKSNTLAQPIPNF